ncbi:UNVERIFIED_CONTAM: hypothetical protein HHA_207170 [Hammondia hammondi]|eukprot:XP_008888817.1 hypothetical protein HHA_207170 [Hammondia hammondi]
MATHNCVRQTAAQMLGQNANVFRFFSKSAPSRPSGNVALESVKNAAVAETETFAGRANVAAGTGKLEGSLLPPPHIPGIRRAPREPASPKMAGMEGRMPVRLPPEGSRFRQYVDPRADFYFPLTAVLVTLGPLYMFSKAFF